ncbi:glycosyltransferase family 2 protein [Algoriphagus sp.]|uniref:glycosyltransferase family 2 protein n=1 Tax=Algoriphagus sp. TaxID=1872435 RepID=UPI00326E1164
MNAPLVSIITVNYKQAEVSGQLLKSLASLSYPHLEVILVDNEQANSDEGFYNQLFPGLQVINSPINLGFAGANNLGIKAASGDFIFLLNNDTEVADGVIEQLVAAFAHPSIGAISPILRYHESPGKIQFAGYTTIHPLTGRNEPIRHSDGDILADTPYIHGAAVMIPRQVIAAVGEMPEEFFLYYEELDWSERIKALGYELKVLKSVSVLHKESISTGKHSPLKVYYQTRNRLHFMRRNFAHAWVFTTFFLLVSLPKNVLSYSLKHQKSHLRAFNLGWRHALLQKRFGSVDPKILLANRH